MFCVANARHACPDCMILLLLSSLHHLSLLFWHSAGMQGGACQVHTVQQALLCVQSKLLVMLRKPPAEHFSALVLLVGTSSLPYHQETG